VHLLAVVDQTSRRVLAQTGVVDARTNEIGRFRSLLDGLDLDGRVVTADALHPQREHADWLVTVKHAAYLLIEGQPAQPPTTSSPPSLARHSDRRPHRDHGHGRTELRRRQVTTVAGLASLTPPRRSASPAGSGRLPASDGGP
jgi:predicted transposase YbfD/YdcC